MPLFIGDYLADTMHLTRDQHGGYLLLIMAYWRGGTPLPDDDGKLAAIVKAAPGEWKRLRPALAAFFQIADGYWRHKRIDSELSSAQTITDERSKAGATGAAARWQNGVEKDGKTVAKGMANASQTDGPSPSHSSLRSEGSVSSLRSDTAASGPVDPQKEVFDLGKRLLGKASGGQITKLLRQVDGDCVRATDLLNVAAGKSDAGEYIAGFLRGKGTGRADDVLAETTRLYRELGVE